MKSRKEFQRIFVVINIVALLLSLTGIIFRIRLIDFSLGNSIAASLSMDIPIISIVIYFLFKIRKLSQCKIPLKPIFYSLCILAWSISAYYCCYGIHWNLTNYFAPRFALPALITNTFSNICCIASSILALIETMKKNEIKGVVTKMNEENNIHLENAELLTGENKNPVYGEKKLELIHLL